MPQSNVPNQSATEFDFLDNLYQDIIDAICDTLDAIAEASTEVSNITLKMTVYKQYRRGQEHCIKAIKGVKQWRVYHAPVSYQITSAFGGTA